VKFKDILKGNFLHEKIGDIFELFEDIIIVLLTILLFILSINALYDIALALFSEKYSFIELIPKFLYVFILTELFRLMIVYLTERRIDTSLIVKTTLIAVLREVVIKAPYLKFYDYIGISVLLIVLGSMYYIPKYIFISEKDFRLKKDRKRIKTKGVKKVETKSDKFG
jgi:Predicted membrane protein